MRDFQLPRFEPLAESRARFLRERSARVIAVVPFYAELRQKLLKLGGIEAVPPGFDESSPPQRARQQHDISQVLQHGRTWIGAQAELEVMETSGCHFNVARLRTSARGQIVTGWALPEDGLWREHSWLIRAAGTAEESILETTHRSLLYHGYVLNEEETGWFIRAELGAQAWPQ
jgi:hypothetical protein